jgi:hypothetical protein
MKYAEVFRNLPSAFPSLSVIRAGVPLVVVEGEFDALLLGQEIGDAASVLTVGSASTALTPELFRALLPASRWFVATDGDAAGDKFASGWPASAVRVRPFGGAKDWTDLHATGGRRIRYHWLPLLGFAAKWEELESQRWGPTLLPDAVLDAVGPPPLDPAWLDELNRLLGRDSMNLVDVNGPQNHQKGAATAGGVQAA